MLDPLDATAEREREGETRTRQMPSWKTLRLQREVGLEICCFASTFFTERVVVSALRISGWNFLSLWDYRELHGRVHLSPRLSDILRRFFPASICLGPSRFCRAAPLDPKP